MSVIYIDHWSISEERYTRFFINVSAIAYTYPYSHDEIQVQFLMGNLTLNFRSTENRDFAFMKILAAMGHECPPGECRFDNTVPIEGGELGDVRLVCSVCGKVK